MLTLLISTEQSYDVKHIRASILGTEYGDPMESVTVKSQTTVDHLQSPRNRRPIYGIEVEWHGRNGLCDLRRGVKTLSGIARKMGKLAGQRDPLSGWVEDSFETPGQAFKAIAKATGCKEMAFGTWGNYHHMSLDRGATRIDATVLGWIEKANPEAA